MEYKTHLHPIKLKKLKTYIKQLDPVLYAPLWEEDGAVARNHAPDNKDAGNGVITGATLGQTGLVGRAYSFDGNNDTMTFTHGSLDLAGNMLSMLIMLKPSSKGSDFANWFHKNFKWGFKWGNSPSGEIFAYVNTGSEVSIQSDAELANDTWHQVVLTYDGSLGSNNLKLYINGSLNAQADVTGDLADTSGTALSINSDTDAMVALVQHIALWNKPLQANEVTKLAKIAGLA